MKQVTCPICQAAMNDKGPKDWPERPFCSKRCRMVDLGRWLGGAYAIETAAAEEDFESEGESTHSPKPAAPSADPHREEA